MKNIYVKILCWLALGAFGCASQPVPPLPSPPPALTGPAPASTPVKRCSSTPYVELSQIDGSDTLLIKRGGQTLKISKNSVIHIGDELIVDANSVARLRAGSTGDFIVGPSSAVRLRQVGSDLEYELVEGIVNFYFRGTTGTSEECIQFRTSEARLTSTGSHFFLIKSAKGTTLKSLGGVINFGPKSGAPLEDVSDFQESQVLSDGEMIAPKPFEEDYLKFIQSYNPMGPFYEIMRAHPRD